jgi:hypothetical protein
MNLWFISLLGSISYQLADLHHLIGVLVLEAFFATNVEPKTPSFLRSHLIFLCIYFLSLFWSIFSRLVQPVCVLYFIELTIVVVWYGWNVNKSATVPSCALFCHPLCCISHCIQFALNIPFFCLFLNANVSHCFAKKVKQMCEMSSYWIKRKIEGFICIEKKIVIWNRPLLWFCCSR